MNAPFQKKLAELQARDQQAFADLESVFQRGKGLKGQKLLEINRVCKYTYILQSGLVRHYRQDEEGKEYNAWFSFEGDIVVAMESWVLQTPSLEGMEVMEDCEYLSFSHQDVLRLTSLHHSIEHFYRQLLELYFIEIERRLYRIQTFTARQKYKYLLEHQSHLIQKVPQNHIASFLGITKETLSRIRKELV